MKIEENLILQEYLDAFLEEILRFLLKAKIYFLLELMPGVFIMSKVHYQMRKNDLVDLKYN